MPDDEFRRRLTAAALTGLLAGGARGNLEDAAEKACKAADMTLAEYRRLELRRSEPAAGVLPNVQAPQAVEACDCWRCCAAELSAAGPD